MRIGLLILPIHPWAEARRLWRDAEEGGFDSAWTYDHLSYQGFRERPWFGAVPVLAAAAAVTERIRLGSLVSSPNVRHPVALAEDVAALDDVSSGRFTLGVGCGTTGFDASALGDGPRSLDEREDRFEEFVGLLDRLLTAPATARTGRLHPAEEARTVPDRVRRPRVPFAVAGERARAMRLAARYGQAWVSCPAGDLPPADCPGRVARRLDRLGELCAEQGRDVKELDRILLTGYTTERPCASVDRFVDLAGRYAEAGVTELVVHLPVADSRFAADERVFARIVEEGLPQVRPL
ncbi:LLM class flavin-dependent oxidoreductase [Kitasatospora sp. NPDC093806]|uniref:LLM class flavin-dependent oxidoreductase n=1 Tax=Kitasatospora sp. NPDC093806 TaxID=3155075 RepID=UPI00341D579C